MQRPNPIRVGQNYAANVELPQRELIQTDRIETGQDQAVIQDARPRPLRDAAAFPVAIGKVNNLVQDVERSPSKEESDQQRVLFHAEVDHSYGQQKRQLRIPRITR